MAAATSGTCCAPAAPIRARLLLQPLHELGAAACAARFLARHQVMHKEVPAKQGFNQMRFSLLSDIELSRPTGTGACPGT